MNPTIAPSSNRRCRTFSARSIALAVVLGACASAGAQCEYTVEVLEKPSNWSSIRVTDRGADGTVVGVFKYPSQILYHPFRWSGAIGYEVLSGPRTVTDRQAQVIADNGLIAGYGDVPGFSDETTQLVIWFRGASWWVPAPDPSMYVTLHDADGDGYVAGSFGSGRLGLFPFVYRNGELLPLPREIAAMHGQIIGINDLGMICGTHGENSIESPIVAFIGTLDAVTDLPPVDGAIHPRAVHLTRNWRAAVRAIIAPARPEGTLLKRGYYWNGQAHIPIGILPDPDADWSEPYDMNEIDQIVGAAGHQSSPPIPWVRAVLWQTGSLYDLNDIAILPPNATLKYALAIDDGGNILVDGKLGTVAAGFILHPITLDAADITIDCKVDSRDLAVVLEEWGSTADAAVPRADLDGDGLIGPADLALVLGAWTAR